MSKSSKIIPYNSNRNEAKCCGTNCKRTPTKLLKVRYVNRIGCFCDVCADDLLEADLAELKIPDAR